MKKLKIPRLAAVNSQNNESALSTDNVGVEVTLENGKHIIEIDGENLSDLLQLPGIEGTASATVQYEYLEGVNAIKLATAHYTGEGANKLVISEGTNFSAEHHRRLGEVLDYFTNRLIEYARNAGMVVLERLDRSILPEELANMKCVYRNGRFLELKNPDKEYTSEDVTIGLGSAYNGIMRVLQGHSFWNVIGSTHDPIPFGVGSWMALWKAVVATYDALQVPPTDFSSQDTCVVCITQETNSVGGHVVLNNQQPGEGTLDDLFIMPLCRACNHPFMLEQMNTNRNTIAVWLNMFHSEVYQ